MIEPMNSIPCDVVLLPNDELGQKAIYASQLLKTYNSFFTLEIGKFYPHMSLYMLQLNEDDIRKIEVELSKISNDFHVFIAKATTYSLGEGFGVGYVDPEYEATVELHDLQQKVIEVINPLRSGMRESDIAKMQDATGIKLENLQKYGYPAIGKLFRPHITLTRLKEHRAEVLDVLPEINTFDGTFDRIGLFVMGENGTCIKKISEFSLSSSPTR